jgi:glycosyltransferase involved in cell wall biosynthesis
VAGLGDYRAELERLAASCGVAGRVHFVGELSHDQVREHLAAADLLAVPSVMEGGAKVLLEAAAVGTPFVATATAGTPAFLPDGGLTTPPVAQAPRAFERALAVLLGNSDLRARLGRRAFEQSRRFSAAARAEELLPLYERAIDSRTAGASRGDVPLVRAR